MREVSERVLSVVKVIYYMHYILRYVLLKTNIHLFLENGEE